MRGHRPVPPSIARSAGFARQTGEVSMQLIWRRFSSLCLFLGALVLLTDRAEAHVKWFCGAVDVTTPPRALAAVLSPTFLGLGAAAAALVAAGSALDALALRRWPSLLRRWRGSERIEEA